MDLGCHAGSGAATAHSLQREDVGRFGSPRNRTVAGSGCFHSLGSGSWGSAINSTGRTTVLGFELDRGLGIKTSLELADGDRAEVDDTVEVGGAKRTVVNALWLGLRDIGMVGVLDAGGAGFAVALPDDAVVHFTLG